MGESSVLDLLAREPGRKGENDGNATPLPVVGNIDYPRAWVVTRGPLIVRGWAVGRDPMRTIGVYWDSRFLGNAELGRDRPDVARAFRNYPEAGRSGFVFVAQRTPNTIDVAAGLRIIATTCSGHSKIFNVSLAKIASRTEAFNYLRDGLSNNPESYAEVARSFSVAGRFDDAEAILTEAVERFPNDAHTRIGLASLAARRGDWAEASIRWIAARERFPNNHDVISGEAQAKHGMWMDLTPVPASGSNTTSRGGRVGAESIQEQGQKVGNALRNSNSELMLKFESLGNNCDFGLVQRYFGSEPLGLLRFAGIKFESLISALRAGFEGVGSPESTRLVIKDIETQEYMLSDSKYNFTMHTFIYSNQVNEDARLQALLHKHCRRLAYLRSKLVSDLESAEKIFVVRSDTIIAMDNMKRLHSELRRYGPNTLLCVYEDDSHSNGTVDVLDVGLAVGYLGLGDPKNKQIPFESWLQICRSAAGL